jgi:cephalosporin-C deacetylase
VEHAFDFDPTYGYSREQLLAVEVPKGPEDFDSFWRETAAENARIPLRLESKQVESPAADFDLFEVGFDSWGGVRIGGWLVVPERVERGFVVGHGYGGREGPELGLPAENAAALFPCAPGFHRSARADIPGNSQEHVVHLIESRERYILRACVASLWSAASALLELCSQVGEELFYAGGSFGGGLGALALPWEQRFRKGYLSVPTFGQHPIRVQCACEGSGKAVRNYYLKHSEVSQVLQYYDAATAATRVEIPVLVSPALFDPAVPPPGQFAVYNGLGEGSELFVLRAGHFEYPGQGEELERLEAEKVNFFAS